jgi:hypothetical protein
MRLLPLGKETDASAEAEWPKAAFDKTLTIAERVETERVPVKVNTEADEPASSASEAEMADQAMQMKPSESRDRNRFYLSAPDIWRDLMDAIDGSRHRSRATQ